VSAPGDSCRLVVVGAGVAGWTAATRAQQLGASVVVLEKSDGPSGGNGMYSAGIVHAAYLSPERPPADIDDAIMEKTGGRARPDVARAWSANVGRAVRFLEAAGAAFRAVGPEEFQAFQVGPADGEPAPHQWLSGGGPARLLTSMCDRFVAAQGDFRPATPAIELAMEDGRAIGVVAQRADGRRELVEADAVLLADGGFQANAELVGRHITPAYSLRGSSLDTGDALRMGVAAGAKAVELGAFYGYVLCRDALTNERLARLHVAGPQPVRLIDAAIVVDGHGRRIANEDAGTAPYALIDEPLAGAIATCETPASCWVVFDNAVWETVARQGRPDKFDVPMNPGLLDAGGTLVSGDTIAAVAAGAGVPADRLRETVEGFNGYCREGAPVDPPRTGSPRPIAEPPFHAVPLITAITYTMGGLLVNGRAQVLDEAEQPIPCLYAAGGAMGGLQGGPANGYSGGWSEAATFGLLTAEDAVASFAGGVAAARET
jgi:fumarate reductase flavoprotein subunit